MSAKSSPNEKPRPNEPTIENRKARHEYFIEDTLECGIELTGTEIKSLRKGQVSLAEGYGRATEQPLELAIFSMHIAEYPPAGSKRQHNPIRPRRLLAHKREIRKLARQTRERGLTLIPLKIYFVRGRAKLLIGVARGKKKTDKRQDLTARQAKRDIDRAMSRRR